MTDLYSCVKEKFKPSVCEGPFKTVREADDYLVDKYGPMNAREVRTTILPLCNYFPQFINVYRACRISDKSLSY